jgi:hypothetical protein
MYICILKFILAYICGHCIVLVYIIADTKCTYKEIMDTSAKKRKKEKGVDSSALCEDQCSEAGEKCYAYEFDSKKSHCYIYLAGEDSGTTYYKKQCPDKCSHIIISL